MTSHVGQQQQTFLLVHMNLISQLNAVSCREDFRPFCFILHVKWESHNFKVKSHNSSRSTDVCSNLLQTILIMWLCFITVIVETSAHRDVRRTVKFCRSQLLHATWWWCGGRLTCLDIDALPLLLLLPLRREHASVVANEATLQRVTWLTTARMQRTAQDPTKICRCLVSPSWLRVARSSPRYRRDIRVCGVYACVARCQPPIWCKARVSELRLGKA